MNIELLPMAQVDIPKFKHDIQEAFQKGFEDVYGETEGTILPEKDIDRSLNTDGCVAYKAIENGEMVGGAVVAQDFADLIGADIYAKDAQDAVKKLGKIFG